MLYLLKKNLKTLIKTYMELIHIFCQRYELKSRLIYKMTVVLFEERVRDIHNGEISPLRDDDNYHFM